MIIFSCKENNKNAMGIDSPEKFAKYANELQNKKHPLLPNKISIQLKDENGENLKMENVLCHLNIYIDSLSYYTYSFIPTNANGIVNLTKEQMIQNTELKHYFDERIPLDKTPVKFDFMVMDNNMIDGIILSMENYLSIDIKSIKADLKSRGFTDAQIALQIPSIEEKMKSDKQLSEFLKKKKNAELDYSNGEKKITDFWNSESEYNYELK
jgi:protein tyrosine phosphatase